MEPPTMETVKKGKNKKREDNMSEGVRRIYTLLRGLDILCHMEVRYHQCSDIKPLPFDFLIVVNGRVGLIEYDGRQHFELVPTFHKNGEEDLKKQKEHDVIKNRFCRAKQISLLRIAHTEDKYI